MIELISVCKSYDTQQGKRTVLNSINLQIYPGEKIGILGRNGAGKSTMIRLMSGAERPSSGVINRDMSISWPLAFGGAFQGSLTGLDNLKFICRVYGVNYLDKINYVQEFSELGEYLNEPIKKYSAGMRARLAFAISMAIEFECFLIDEIVAVGDSRFHKKCQFELFELRKDRAMIIVSHDSGYIREHCDRVAVLVDGHLYEFDSMDESFYFYESDFKALPTINGEYIPLSYFKEVDKINEDESNILKFDEKSKNKILNLKYKNISFDIFDTLLFFKVEPYERQQRDICALHLNILQKYTHSEISLESILTLRMNLFLESKNITGDEIDYTFVNTKICEKLGVDNGQIQSVLSEMLLAETSYMYEITFVNESAIDLIKQLKIEGKSIIAISDMYLPKASILEIIKLHGLYDLFEDIFVSSEFLVSKHTGNFYEYLIKNSLINNSIVHIGDNYHSDVVMARSNNVTAIHYYDFENLIRKKYLWESTNATKK